MRPETLEHYLITLHKGQWFGFNNQEPTYANLVILDETKTKPTEQECIDGLAQLQADYDWQEVRTKRNKLLAETDFYALSDVTMSSEMAIYRQALRDLPSTQINPDDIIFPEKP
jgi:hypothetical protein